MKHLKRGAIQVILAKKVLDEGIDIPALREAFIVASSTIEREWIQRRGRVLRKHSHKPWAIIHDFLALPPSGLVSRNERASFSKIISNELDRAYAFGSFARNAIGPDSVQVVLEQIRQCYRRDNKLGAGVLEKQGMQHIASGTPEGKPW